MKGADLAANFEDASRARSLPGFRFKNSDLGKGFRRSRHDSAEPSVSFRSLGALVPIAVSRNLEENEPVIMSGTGGMAATAAHTAGSPGHSALHQRQTHRQISIKARAPLARI